MVARVSRLTGLVAAVGLGACSTGAVRQAAPLPPPPSTRATTTTAAPPDLSQRELPSVRGSVTTTTVALGPGPATLKGTVTSPSGAVPGATVRIERLVGNDVAATEVFSTDGTWDLASVAGGRYRVRAWRAPDFAQVEPAMVFVSARDTASIELKLERFAGPFPAPVLAPAPPVVEQPANLVVLLTQRSVDPAGIVRAVPIPGARVELSGTGLWLVRSLNPTVTDSAGRGRWELRCRAAGAQPLNLVVNGTETFALTLPACVDPPAVVEPATPGASTSIPTATTTTRPSSTTTTTRRR